MLVKQVFNLAKRFFIQSENRAISIGLLALVIGAEFFSVYMYVLLNEWNNSFYSSLQDLNQENFWIAMVRFSKLAGVFILSALMKMFFSLWLKLEWRSWMTKNFLSKWIDGSVFYGMKVISAEADNPDQRLSQDIEKFTEYSLSLFLGFLNAVTTLISFGIVLWGLSGVETVQVFGYRFNVHGWLVIAAFIYALLATFIMNWVGKVLYSLIFKQEAYEANLRYSLMRVREHAESIAIYDANAFEKNFIFARFSFVIANTKAIIKKNLQMVSFSSFYSQVSIVFPYIVMSPKFFASKIKLGALMQTASAFGSVQTSFSFIINSYSTIATLRAVVERLIGFLSSAENWETKKAEVAESFLQNDEVQITLTELEIKLPDGDILLKCKNFAFTAGSYLIKGSSGGGKSTLFRSIAGFWPYLSGTISMPPKEMLMFIPQNGYIPIGTLYEAICFPKINFEDREKVIELLKLTKLGYLKKHIDETNEWSGVLSGGEKQKIAFIRAIIAAPRIILLDEATSSMDEESEDICYALLKQMLPNAVIISIAHRNSIAKHHDTILVIKDKKLALAS